MTAPIANRNEVSLRLVVDGDPLLITLIQNVTIDDVLNTEARIQATSIETGDPSLVASRQVNKSILDYLIRLGVER